MLIECVASTCTHTHRRVTIWVVRLCGKTPSAAMRADILVRKLDSRSTLDQAGELASPGAMAAVHAGCTCLNEKKASEGRAKEPSIWPRSGGSEGVADAQRFSNRWSHHLAYKVSTRGGTWRDMHAGALISLLRPFPHVLVQILAPQLSLSSSSPKPTAGLQPSLPPLNSICSLC
jgi:hypothetical protein